MHPNRAFAWEDEGAMLAFLGEIAFCTICAEGPVIAHAPSGFRLVERYAACSRTVSRSSCSITASR